MSRALRVVVLVAAAFTFGGGQLLALVLHAVGALGP